MLIKRGLVLACASACLGAAAIARAEEAPALGLRLALPVPEASAQPAPAHPRHLTRVIVETAGLLGAGTGWYWWNHDFNSPDWDLGWDRESWRRKLLSTDALRFDQNPFQTNAVLHPAAGVAAYQIARGNGLGPLGAFVSAAAAGAFWEYVIEFRELPSLNDLIVNPTAGFALGEPLFQLGELFRASAPHAVNRALGGLFSPVAAMNDAGEEAQPRFGALDDLGLSRAVWHRS